MMGDVRARWIRDDAALSLLDGIGEPFSASPFRRAWIEGAPGWNDVSFAARTTDGTHAAIALLRRRSVAHSLPFGYGGVIASRALDSLEMASLLRAAQTAARAYEIRVLSVPIDSSPERRHGGGHVVGSTSVVYLDRNA